MIVKRRFLIIFLTAWTYFSLYVQCFVVISSPSRRCRSSPLSPFKTEQHQQRTKERILKGRERFKLLMSLIPIPASELDDILCLSGAPTGEQFASYYGRTSRERYNALFEAGSVTFLGLWASYFISFVVGSPIATMFGSAAAMYFLIGPEIKAIQRNWELRGGRDLVDVWTDGDDDGYGEVDENGLYGAVYFAYVTSACVVKDEFSDEEYELDDFYDYTMENDELEAEIGIPWKFRLLLRDKNKRELQIHARMSQDYTEIKEGMPIASILLSTRRDFSSLDGLTDIFVPDIGSWVGDYPYLSKGNFIHFLTDDHLVDVLEDERDAYTAYEASKTKLPTALPSKMKSKEDE